MYVYPVHTRTTPLLTKQIADEAPRLRDDVDAVAVYAEELERRLRLLGDKEYQFVHDGRADDDDEAVPRYEASLADRRAAYRHDKPPLMAEVLRVQGKPLAGAEPRPPPAAPPPSVGMFPVLFGPARFPGCAAPAASSTGAPIPRSECSEAVPRQQERVNHGSAPAHEHATPAEAGDRPQRRRPRDALPPPAPRKRAKVAPVYAANRVVIVLSDSDDDCSC